MGLLHARLAKYDLPQKMMEKGIYPYFRQITSKQGTEVTMDGHQIMMFGSKGYTPSICVNGTDTPLVRVRPDEGFENGMGTAELTVHEGDSLKVTITNSSRLGALRISKTVAGSFGDRFAKFPFRIELTQLQGGTVKPLTDTELIVIKKNGEVIGDEFADGVLEIELGHGDVLLIEGIYDGVYYSVSETDHGYYEVSVSGLSEGTIRRRHYPDRHVGIRCPCCRALPCRVGRSSADNGCQEAQKGKRLGRRT